MNKEFFYELLDTMSVSGHEIGLQKKVIAEMKPYCGETMCLLLKEAKQVGKRLLRYTR